MTQSATVTKFPEPSNSPRRLKDWITAYIDYTDDTEAPVDFHMWTALVTLAGAVQRKVWIDMAHFQWVCNLYVMLVGEPGIVTKSTSIRIGQNLLRGVKGFVKGPDSTTWQALLDSFTESASSFKFNGGDMVQSPLTLFIAELGNFIDPTNREAMDLLTDMWDGQATTFTRRTRLSGTNEIVNPWLNFIGCTTPTWVQNNFSADLVGGGFASRLIVIFGEKKRKRIAYPGISHGGLKTEMEDDLIHDLRHIARLTGPMKMSTAPETTTIVTAKGEVVEKHYPGGAIQWGEEWYDSIQDNRGKETISRRATGYYARKQAHLHKIAMLVSMSERDDLLVTIADLVSAHNVLLMVERDMMKVLSNITNRQVAARNAMEIIQLLKSGMDLTEHTLYSHLWTYMSKKDYELALESLQAAGKVYTENVKGKGYLRVKL